MTLHGSDPGSADTDTPDPMVEGRPPGAANLDTGLRKPPNEAVLSATPTDSSTSPDEPRTAPPVSGTTSSQPDLSSDLAAAQAQIARLEARERRRRPLLIGCFLIVALLIGGPLVATAILDRSRPNGPDVQTIGFGTGGSGCTLTNVGSTFSRGVPIRDVLTFSPALPADGTVTITVERNGTELVDLGDTITVHEPSDCIYGTMRSLEVGHYRIKYQITPSTMPPITGEFDVTP